MKHLTSVVLCLSMFALVGGCGGLEPNAPSTGPDARPFTGVLRGSLAGPTETTGGPISVAIIWRGTAAGAPWAGFPRLACDAAPSSVSHTQLHGGQEAQTVTVAAGASFALAIDSPPPAGARADLAAYGGQGTLSVGEVIAYRDVNGNGRYDFGTPTREPEPMLAASANVFPHLNQQVIYLDGTLPPAQVTVPGGSDGGTSLDWERPVVVQGLPLPSLPAGFHTQGLTVSRTGWEGISGPFPGVFGTPAEHPITLHTQGQLPVAQLGCESSRVTVVTTASPSPGATVSCIDGAPDFAWRKFEQTGTCAAVLETGKTCGAMAAAAGRCP